MSPKPRRLRCPIDVFRYHDYRAFLAAYYERKKPQGFSYRAFAGLFTHQFLHGGWLHLLFNLWFLWLVGCNVEDAWGRPLFASFYLSGGAVAGLVHGWMTAPNSLILIGASGAVAAAMGAFLVGFARTKIHSGVERSEHSPPALLSHAELLLELGRREGARLLYERARSFVSTDVQVEAAIRQGLARTETVQRPSTSPPPA